MAGGRFGVINAETLAKILAATGERTPEATPEAEPKIASSVFVPPGTWVVGVRTFSVLNDERSRRQAFGRKASQRAATVALLSRHLAALVPFAEARHAGRPLRVKFTRLAPREVDPSALGGACKYVEDVFADFLAGGVDRPPLWLADWGQERSPRYGVRIEILLAEETST